MLYCNGELSVMRTLSILCLLLNPPQRAAKANAHDDLLSVAYDAGNARLLITVDPLMETDNWLLLLIEIVQL